MMYSSSKFHISDRFKSFLLSGAFDLLGACVPSEFLLEREDAPRGSWLDMLGLQAQHYQIRHKRNGHRSFHSRGILSDLCMPQTQSAFQFLETDLHRPSSKINRYHYARCYHREIGHEQFSLFGAVVTPPSTEDHGDIAKMAQLGMFDEGPEGPLPARGNQRGHPDSMVMMDGQVGDDIPQILAIGELPGTGEGNDKEPAAGLNGLEIFARGIGGIGDHNHAFAPSWQHQGLKHVPNQPRLRPIILVCFRFDQTKIQRNTVDTPLGDEQHQVQPNGKRGMLVQASLLDQGVFQGSACLSRCYPPLDTAPHPRGVERLPRLGSPASRAPPPTANARRPAIAAGATTRCAWGYSGPGLYRWLSQNRPDGPRSASKRPESD